MSGALIANCAKQLFTKYHCNVSHFPVSIKTLTIRCSPMTQGYARRFVINSFNLEHDEPTDGYRNFLDSKKVGVGMVRKYLIDNLECEEECIELILKKYGALAERTKGDLGKNYEICKEAGLTEDVIKDNLWLLSFPPEMLEQKIRHVRKLGIEDLNDSVPFMTLRPTKLQSLLNVLRYDSPEIPGGNRIKYFATKLKCKTRDVCRGIAKHCFLQTIPFERIHKIMDLLLDSHVNSEDILKDLWVFRYNPSTVESRLKRAQEAGIYPLKPWMVRCLESSFTKMIERENNRRELLGKHSTTAEYISQRLNYDQEHMKHIISLHPMISNVNMPKVKNLLDFLIDEGFTAQHIFLVPQIWLHNVDMMKDRLAQLREIDHNPQSLLVLCLSRRQYKLYLNKVLARKKSKKTNV